MSGQLGASATGIAVLSGCHPSVPFEGFDECSHRFVACCSRDRAQMVATCTQPLGRRVNSEASDITLWRFTNQLREPCRKGGSGHRQSARK